MNVIIPAAGRSSRYKSKKPKYLLTHPNGLLMIEIVFRSLINRIENCKIYIVILREHDLKYDASTILRQVAASNNASLNIMIIDEMTRGPAETVYNCLKHNEISGPFLIKDSDNVIDFNSAILDFNGCDGFLLGGDIALHNVVDVHQKSFIIADSNGRVTNFVEKRVVSNIVCFGLYGFTNTKFFIQYFDSISSLKYSGELYVSQVVQSALLDDRLFFYREALSLSDWGIWSQWMQERKRLRTFFVDFDGVIVRNTGRYGDPNWDSSFKAIDTNIIVLKKLSDSGSQIVLTTARPQQYREMMEEFFRIHGIIIFSYVFGLNHSERVLLNDYSDSNPFPSATALNIFRNGDLSLFSDALT
jgi:hypothetical protein